jgi:uncharacterized protein (DUF433 family)
VTEQATVVFEYEAKANGEATSSSEPNVYTGRPEALLKPPTLGIPAIAFTEGPAGRRATVTGTGLDVWEIVATWREIGENFERLRTAYHWLSEGQLRTALEYYEHNTEEIEARLAREQEWTPEAVWERFPYARPRS